MALVHNAGKLKFGAEKKGKKEKSVFEQLDTEARLLILSLQLARPTYSSSDGALSSRV
jgi:hypothetical protein